MRGPGGVKSDQECQLRRVSLVAPAIPANRDLRQSDRRLHLTRQIRVIESVSVDDAFVLSQLKILSSEGVTLPGGEIGERHPVSAANSCLELVNLARESIWRKPFDHCS